MAIRDYAKAKKYRDGGRVVPVPGDPALEETQAFLAAHPLPEAEAFVAEHSVPAAADVPAPAPEPDGMASRLEAHRRAQEQAHKPPELSAAKREWLDRNPHLAVHGDLLGKLHQAVLQHGVVQDDSDQYFREMRNGLDQVGIRHDQPATSNPFTNAEPAPLSPPPLPPAPSYGGPPVSAPVSRTIPGGSVQRRGRVELSAAQREAARISGVDEITYAKGVLELARRKADGMYEDQR